MLVLWWLVALLAAPAHSAAPNIVVALNTFKWLRLTSDKFLGLSVSPGLLSSTLNYSATTLTMLQGLAPAYLRVEWSNNAGDLNFKTTNNFSTNTLIESLLTSVNQLATDAGLRLIFSLDPSEFGQQNNLGRRSSVMNTTKLEHLLSLSEQQGYDPVWQFGYKASSMMNGTYYLSGKELGRDVIALRNVLDKFPKYQKTAVLGPDFTIIDKSKDLQFLKDFMIETNDIVNVLMLQTKHQSNKNLEDDVFKSLLEPVISMSKMLRMPSQSGRGKQLTKKQLWIAESEDGGYTGEFMDAMTWAEKLGHAGKLGYNVVLRQPTQLTSPTPDYWVSLLHRNLVGSAVLSTRLMSGHSAVTVFANCAAYYERAARSVLDPAVEYERGAVVVWGVNRGQESAQLTLLTVRQEYAHLYALMASPGDKKRGKTLLNRKPLSLNHGFLPKLTPQVQSTSHNMSVRVPARSVFFIVLPHTKARACLSPAGLSRREELINPEWEQWRNTKSLVSTAASQSDFFFERGGLYSGSEDVVNNLGVFKNKFINSKDNAQIRVNDVKDVGTVVEPQNIKNMNKKLKHLSVTDILQDVSKVKAIDNILGTALLKNKSTQEEYRNIEIENTVIDFKNISEATTNKNRVLASNETIMLENSRVKRSDSYTYSKENTNYLPQEEISPLYRKFHHLHRNKLTNDNNSMPKFTSVGNFKPQIKANKTISKKLSKISNETEMNNATYHYENLLQSEKIIKKMNNTPSKLLENIDNENENFHYHPGTFYETLGNFKINSNLSLADIEEQQDPFAVMLKESIGCKSCESMLKVIKRPENAEEVDRKIVESKEKYIEQVLKNTEEFQKHHSLCGSTKLKNGEIEHGSGDDGEVHKSHTIADTEDTKDVARSVDASPNFLPEKVFTEKRAKDLSFKTLERGKRDTEPFKFISQIFNKNASEELSDKNSTSMPHPEEMQLRMFLQEVTEEGEQLLKSFDYEYEHLHKQNKSEQNKLDFQVLSSSLNTTISRNGDTQTFASDDQSEKDFFIKTNLITDNTIKPRRTYNSTMPVNFLHSSNNISNTEKLQNDSQIKTKNIKIETLQDSGKDIKKFLRTIPLKLNDLISTESTHDLNSKLTLPGEEIPKPNKISFLNLLTPEPPVHYFLNSDDNRKLTQESNSDEINNPETTITSKNILNPFQEEKIFLPPSKTFTSLQQDYLDKKNFIENNTDANLYLKLTLPNDEAYRSSETISRKSANSKIFQQHINDLVNLKVDQDSKVKKTTNPEATMSSDVVEKYFSGERNPLPAQTYKNLDGKTNADVKESMIFSMDTGTPRVKSSFVETDPPKRNFKTAREKINQLNNLAPDLMSQDSINKKFSPVNEITKTQSFLQSIPSKINSFNTPLGLLGGVKATRPLTTVKFLNKQKERLDALTERLNKAREHLQNLTHYHPKPNLPTLKLPKVLTKNIISELKRNNDVNKQHNLITEESKIPVVKKQLDSDDMLYDSGISSRRKRQTSNAEKEEQGLPKASSVKLESPSPVLMINKESVADIIIESSYTPIHKWIIPLSNHTERIVMKNKIFPVKLFGVLADDWQSQNNKKVDSVNDSERKARSVRYSCMRDNFDDYSAEGESVDGTKVEKDIKEVSHPSLQLNDNLPKGNPILISSPQNLHRNKRSVRNEANINNFDIKSRLTNEEIEEGISNIVPDQEPNTNTFSFMLQKQVAEIMKNKTGLDRMFELAKLYHKTNIKNSLEIFKSNGNVKITSSETDGSEEETKTVEDSNSKETINKTNTERYSENHLAILFSNLNNTIVNNQSSNQQNKSSATTAGNGTTNQTPKISNKNIFSVLKENIQVLYETFNSAFKTLFSNVKSFKPIKIISL